MAGVTGALVRRGVEAHSYMNGQKVKIDIPVWGIIMLASTALAFVAITFMVRLLRALSDMALIFVTRLNTPLAESYQL